MEPSRLLELLDDSCPPFALLRRRTPGRDHDTVEVLIGAVHEAGLLAELPVRELPTLALVPFRQIRERGFDVRDDGTPLTVLAAEEAYEVPSRRRWPRCRTTRCTSRAAASTCPTRSTRPPSSG